MMKSDLFIKFLLFINKQLSQSTSGQSVVEFLLVLPLLVGLVLLLIKINTAIQVSIVNQQYARAQIHWLTFNSAFSPQIGLRNANFQAKGYNRMVIGVSSNKAPGEGEPYIPEATTQVVVRNGQASGRDGSSQEEPVSRSRVRVRNTISLCTQTNVITGGSGGVTPLTAASLIQSGEGSPGQSKILLYCRSPFDE